MSHALATKQLCADITAGTATQQDLEKATTRLDALDLFVSMMGEGNLSEYQKDERRQLRAALGDGVSPTNEIAPEGPIWPSGSPVNSKGDA